MAMELSLVKIDRENSSPSFQKDMDNLEIDLPFPTYKRTSTPMKFRKNPATKVQDLEEQKYQKWRSKLRMSPTCFPVRGSKTSLPGILAGHIVLDIPKHHLKRKVRTKKKEEQDKNAGKLKFVEKFTNFVGLNRIECIRKTLENLDCGRRVEDISDK